VYRRANEIPHPEYLSYSILLLLSLSIGLDSSDVQSLESVSEILFLISHIILLILLLVVTRLIQPDYARYPTVYSYIPILFVPVYIYFIDTPILSNITFMTLQATSLTVFTGMVFIYSDTIKKGYLLIFSVALFLSAMILFWYLNIGLVNVLTQLLTGTGMILACFKVPSLINKNKR